MIIWVHTKIREQKGVILKGWGRFLSRGEGIAYFNRRKNAIFWELGIGARSDNFSHKGMTQWGAPRVWGAPKSICTHAGTRLKKIAEKRRFLGQHIFCGPNGRKSCLGRADNQNLLIYPRTPQNIYVLIGGLEKILPKMLIFPQMEKFVSCAVWVHIIGVRAGKIKSHTIPPCSINISW